MAVNVEALQADANHLQNVLKNIHEYLMGVNTSIASMNGQIQDIMSKDNISKYNKKLEQVALSSAEIGRVFGDGQDNLEKGIVSLNKAVRSLASSKRDLSKVVSGGTALVDRIDALGDLKDKLDIFDKVADDLSKIEELRGFLGQLKDELDKIYEFSLDLRQSADKVAVLPDDVENIIGQINAALDLTANQQVAVSGFLLEIKSNVGELNDKLGSNIDDMKILAERLGMTVKSYFSQIEENSNKLTAQLKDFSESYVSVTADVKALREILEKESIVERQEKVEASLETILQNQQVQQGEQKDVQEKQQEYIVKAESIITQLEETSSKQIEFADNLTEKAAAAGDNLTLKTAEVCDVLSEKVTAAGDNLTLKTTEACDALSEKFAAAGDNLTLKTTEVCDVLSEKFTGFGNELDVKASSINEELSSKFIALQDEVQTKLSGITDSIAEKCSLIDEKQNETSNKQMDLNVQQLELSGKVQEVGEKVLELVTIQEGLVGKYDELNSNQQTLLEQQQAFQAGNQEAVAKMNEVMEQQKALAETLRANQLETMEIIQNVMNTQRELKAQQRTILTTHQHQLEVMSEMGKKSVGGVSNKSFAVSAGIGAAVAAVILALFTIGYEIVGTDSPKHDDGVQISVENDDGVSKR